MYTIKRLLLFTCSLWLLSLARAQTIEGELKKWHKVTLSFEGPQTSETASKNPFADYRLEVTFKNGSTTYNVPGYYAADGNAANTSANSGNIWRVHFAPDAVGTWTYSVSFKEGNDVAINGGGQSAGFMDGKTGSFSIAPTDKTGRDHRAKGRLDYVGEHYLQYAETKEWFVKAGADAPENKFSYVDFDATPRAKKDWAPHLQDYVASDASDYTWKNGKGKGILGAVAYLSGKGVNAFSFLTFSLDGDDKTIFPHLGKVNDVRNWSDVHHDRFDVSKMDQWEKVFEYGDKKGMYLHFKTQETENDQKMDGGDVGRERKLYYRELVARYGHHLALNWNLGEENTQTTQQERAMAQYFYDIDPYGHNIVMHTYPGQKNRYDDLIGNQSKLTGASLQTSNNNFNEVFGNVDEWVTKSANAGKKWIVAVDEPGNASIGTDVDPNDIKLIRHKVVWATLMAGGTGVEFYYGYQSGCSDLTCEDHRTRDQKYTDASYALKFFQKYFQQFLPNVVNDNSATGDGSDYVLRSTSKNAYAIYRPNGGSTGITLPNSNWELQWYNPRNGQLQNASSFTGNTLNAPDNNDWVALLTSDGSITPEPDPTPDPDPTPGDCNTVILMDAIDNFPNIDVAGFVPAYKDNARDALAVDASQYKDQYAAAEAAFQGPAGKYDIRINTLMESDGESTYKVYIGKTLIGTYTNPASNSDYGIAGTSWNDISVQTGDIIRVEFNTATNQKIAEGSGYAYSRGRWRSLVFTCTGEETPEEPTPDPDPNPIPDPDPVPPGEMIFEEIDGYVAVEAEHFISQEKTDKRQWYVTGINQDPNINPDPDGNHAQSASGGEYLEILPDTRVTHDDPLVNGVSFSNKPGVLGILTYKIYFNNPGKYYVWVRAHSTGSEDNGIHVGLNGNWPNTGERMQWCNGKRQWTWESKQRTNANHCGEPRLIYLDIPSKGIHTIHFSMREDGFEFDKFYLSKAYDKPSGNGPEERLYQQSTPEPDPCADNTTPAIELTSPTEGAVYESGTNVEVKAVAEDADGNIEMVTFMLDGKEVGADNAAPYSINLNNLTTGSHVLTAVATDDCKATTTSKAITITIKAPETPTDPPADPIPGDCNTVITMDATTDFANIEVEGFVPAYVDNAREALAIDAAEYKDQYAAANTTFEGPTGTYNVQLNTLVESDGESTYKLYVGGELVGTFINPSSDQDYLPASETFTNISVKNGDLIQVEFNTATNKKFQNGGEYGYSRGRWQSLVLTCIGNEEPPTPDPCAENIAPIVELVSPEANSTMELGAELMMKASATDTDGAVKMVTFYLNGENMGSDDTEPYSMSVKDIAEGTHKLAVVAMDTCGMESEMDELSITVEAPAPPSDPEPTPGDCNTIIAMDATSDFPNINLDGFVPAYKDNTRDALAVDAAQYKDQFAAANSTFDGPTGMYDITLNTLVESDGESTYKLYVGGVLIGTFVNPSSETDYLPAMETWKNVSVKSGDLIQVEFNTATNKKIQNGSEYGYSRGRWQSLVFTCVGEDITEEPDTTVSSDPPTPIEPDPLPVDKIIPGMIQAEAFDDQQGIKTQGTADQGGGENVGWIQNGDYTSYQVYAETTAVYTVTFRVASATNGGDIKLYADEEEVASISVGNTGGWQSWKSITTHANLEQGKQNLKMMYVGANGYLLNVNWVSFEVGASIPEPDPKDPCQDNQAPNVSITQPTTSTVPEGSNVEFYADAKDSDGEIQTVEYFLNGKPVQLERVYPYTYTLENAPAGNHEIVAIATDDCGLQTQSIAFKLEVTSVLADDPLPPVTDCQDFVEQNGIVVMEAESLPVQAPWVKKKDNLATGGTYIQWTGGNSYGNSNKGVTNVSITINKTGTYRFLWRMRQPDGVRSDLSNDSWINFPDTKFMNKDGKAYDGFIKVFGNGKGNFAWRATADVNHQKSPIYVEFTQPGTYTFQLAGRSDLHQIDRIVLFHESVSQSAATNESLNETRCFSAESLDGARTALPDEEVEEVPMLTTFPNPAFDRLYIEGEELEEKMVRIFDVQGREVLRKRFENPVDISRLSPGMYHLMIGTYPAHRFIKK